MSSSEKPKQGKGRNRFIYDGMSVYRYATSPELTAVCNQLVAIEFDNPDLEARHPQPIDYPSLSRHKRRAPIVQEIGSPEIINNKSAIGHLVLSQVGVALYERIPTYRESMNVTMDLVSYTETSNNNEFLSVHLSDADHDMIQRERMMIQQVIADLAETDDVYWRYRSADMTVAYVGSDLPEPISDRAIEIVTHALPFTVTLSPASI